MSGKTTGPDAHEEARKLGEQALEALEDGNEKRADALIGKARKIDQSALEEIVQDMDEDAGSDPATARKTGGTDQEGNRPQKA